MKIHEEIFLVITNHPTIEFTTLRINKLFGSNIYMEEAQEDGCSQTKFSEWIGKVTLC